jgi:hypothetical protein
MSLRPRSAASAAQGPVQVPRVRNAIVDEHGVASGITGVLDGESPATRCANGPLHVSRHLDHPHTASAEYSRPSSTNGQC